MQALATLHCRAGRKCGRGISSVIICSNEDCKHAVPRAMHPAGQLSAAADELFLGNYLLEYSSVGFRC